MSLLGLNFKDPFAGSSIKLQSPLSLGGGGFSLPHFSLPHFSLPHFSLPSFNASGILGGFDKGASYFGHGLASVLEAPFKGIGAAFGAGSSAGSSWFNRLFGSHGASKSGAASGGSGGGGLGSIFSGLFGGGSGTGQPGQAGAGQPGEILGAPGGSPMVYILVGLALLIGIWLLSRKKK